MSEEIEDLRTKSKDALIALFKNNGAPNKERGTAFRELITRAKAARK